MNRVSPAVTIILPTLNESACREKIESLWPHLEGYSYEIIVVDDSRDDKFEELKADMAGLEAVRLVKGDRNGKGAAIRKAALIAAGDVVFYMDADLRIPLGNIRIFADMILRQGFDLVVAQRVFHKTPRSFLRLWLSFVLLWIVRIFVFSSAFFSDTQCGFKAFRRDVLKALSQRQSVMGGMYDVEYLYMARMNGLKIGRVSVSPLPEIRATRINLGKCMLLDVFDLVRIKGRGLLRQYRVK